MNVTAINSRWNLYDYLNVLRVRFSFRRDEYSICPGIYSLGNPDKNSPVFVTANYKYTFNIVRKKLAGINCYIIVLDTNGVNVWCAAGKGTFGTEELIERIRSVNLADIINHKKIILPQLGAPGITPAKVKAATGFSISYGPVDAADLKEYISKGYSADRKMRTKTFNIGERFAVSITHFVQAVSLTFLISILLTVLDFLLRPEINTALFRNFYVNSELSFSSLLTGSIIAGIMLPILPGKAFALKGFFISLIFSAVTYTLKSNFNSAEIDMVLISKLIFLSCWIIFQVLNLTGSSTYTSLSGVRKEMKYTIPLLIIATGIGFIFYITGGFIL